MFSAPSIIIHISRHFGQLLSLRPSWKYQSKFCRWKSVEAAIMKLESPEFYAILSPEVKVLEKLFVDNNHEVRIAGGAVRDLLLGIQPKDLDFATTATPDEMKEIFTKNEIRMVNMGGEKHGTITPRINDKENFEVTTLRIDIRTDGRRAEVEFTKDWKLDACRRDLTINSLFLGLDGTVYDYCNGYEDLKKKRVVFVNDAQIRIREDYLRILRYFRFYGRIAENAKNHDEPTLQAISDNVDGLAQISGERIWSELEKILEGRFGSELLLIMLRLDIGPYIGLPSDSNLSQLKEVNACLEKVKKPFQAITLLCGCLNTVDEFMVFHGRCKLSVYTRELGLFIIKNRNEVAQSIRAYQEHVVLANKPAHVRQYVEELLKYKGQKETLELFQAWETPRFPVNGHMINQKVPNLRPVHMGIVLKKLKAIWVESDFKMLADELLEQAPDIVATLDIKKKNSN